MKPRRHPSEGVSINSDRNDATSRRNNPYDLISWSTQLADSLGTSRPRILSRLLRPVLSTEDTPRVIEGRMIFYLLVKEQKRSENI